MIKLHVQESDLFFCKKVIAFKTFVFYRRNNKYPTWLLLSYHVIGNSKTIKKIIVHTKLNYNFHCVFRCSSKQYIYDNLYLRNNKLITYNVIPVILSINLQNSLSLRSILLPFVFHSYCKIKKINRSASLFLQFSSNIMLCRNFDLIEHMLYFHQMCTYFCCFSSICSLKRFQRIQLQRRQQCSSA